MDFAYYMQFFHDGSLIDIKYSEDGVDFEISSFAISASQNEQNIHLDKMRTMHGILKVRSVSTITINDKIFKEKLTMQRPGNTLLDFEIGKERVELGVQWHEYNPLRFGDFSYITIACKKLLWKDLLGGNTFDITDLLRWPADYLAQPISVANTSLMSKDGTSRCARKTLTRTDTINVNWPPGRDDIEAVQNGWKLVSGIEQNVAHFQEVKNLATGEVWRFDRAKYGASGPRGIDHWHHLNAHEAFPERYLDLDGKPCQRKREASRIYYRTGSSQQLPPEGNPVLSFAYYMGFFHDGEVTSINHDGDSMEIALSSSQVLPQYSCSGIGLDEKGFFCGVLFLKNIGAILVDRTRFHEKLVMKSGQAELLGVDIEGGRVQLGVLWLDCPQTDASCFSAISIRCEGVFWELSHGNVILDVSQLLKG